METYQFDLPKVLSFDEIAEKVNQRVFDEDNEVDKLARERLLEYLQKMLEHYNTNMVPAVQAMNSIFLDPEQKNLAMFKHYHFLDNNSIDFVRSEFLIVNKHIEIVAGHIRYLGKLLGIEIVAGEEKKQSEENEQAEA